MSEYDSKLNALVAETQNLIQLMIGLGISIDCERAIKRTNEALEALGCDSINMDGTVNRRNQNA